MSSAARRANAASLFVTAAMAAFLAACSGNVQGPTSSTTGTPRSTTTTAAATTTTGAGTTAACAARDLVITVTGSEGAAGTREVTFGMRNTSGSSCPMDGFPGIQLLDASGAQLTTHVVQGGGYGFTDAAPTALTLAPGATAYVNLGYSDVPTASESSCPTAAKIEIFPPHASDAGTVAVSMTVCDGGTVTVSPVFLAGSGTETTAPAQP